MDGGTFPGVSANCRWAEEVEHREVRGKAALMLGATRYSNQTPSLIQMTPGPDPLWGLHPHISGSDASRTFGTVSFPDSELGWRV